MRVFIAGPYSSDPESNVSRALIYAEQLLAYGYIPFVSHLFHFWHLQFPHDYEIWTAMDRQWLRFCDAVLRFPGESKGADNEVRIAKELGIPVYYDIMELEKAKGRR